MEMSGVEHYREAARLLEEAKREREAPTPHAAWCLELAKVHAHLALAAATGVNSGSQESLDDGYGGYGAYAAVVQGDDPEPR